MTNLHSDIVDYLDNHEDDCNIDKAYGLENLLKVVSRPNCGVLDTSGCVCGRCERPKHGRMLNECPVSKSGKHCKHGSDDKCCWCGTYTITVTFNLPA